MIKRKARYQIQNQSLPTVIETVLRSIPPKKSAVRAKQREKSGLRRKRPQLLQIHVAQKTEPALRESRAALLEEKQPRLKKIR
jgi:hypothetical protein